MPMPRVPRPVLSAMLALACAGLVACGGDDAAPATADDAGEPASQEAGSGQRFPTIEDVETSDSGDGTVFAVTISSPYDSPERYGDGWRILDDDDNVLDETELGHDHASEQPFTRSSVPVEIPDGVDRVFVEPSDTENGFGGEKFEVDVG